MAGTALLMLSGSKNSVIKLAEEFGYVEKENDKWTIYNDCLVVINPNFRPRVYSKGCKGIYVEIGSIL